jgi:hypothetical protein
MMLLTKTTYTSLGVKEEGLFRVSASLEDVRALKKQMDKGKSTDLSKIKNIHVISGALKLYFREMEPPIFTYELYEPLLLTAGNCASFVHQP